MLKKKLTAFVAVLTVLGGLSAADAGIFYGNGIANRVNGSRMGGLFRAIGNMERQKDIWIFGRPLGESRPVYNSRSRGYYYDNGYYYQQTTPRYYYYYPNQR